MFIDEIISDICLKIIQVWDSVQSISKIGHQLIIVDTGQ